MVVWEAREGALKELAGKRARAVLSVVFSPEGATLAAGHRAAR
jgi:hypothetical protein